VWAPPQGKVFEFSNSGLMHFYGQTVEKLLVTKSRDRDGERGG